MPARSASPPPDPPVSAPNHNDNDIDHNHNNSNNHKTANHVYILHPQHSWIPAQVVEHSSSSSSNPPQVVVTIPQYPHEQAIVCDGGRTALRWQKQTLSTNDYPNQALPLQNVNHDGLLTAVEDMVDLPFLHEAAILYNLKARHIQSLPYTRTGDIVVAVNPYHWYHHLYTPAQQDLYANALVWQTAGGADDPRTRLKPHVYEASCLAYKGLLQDGTDQSILVSGESGAGKTETVKILLGDLASVQQQPQKQQHHHLLDSDDATNNNTIVQKVLETNPLLEAFGNAQTLRNDNSSRFGKYLQLQFDRRSASVCLLAGSKCEVYLLEKSRVTLHHPEERTYHVLYQLLAAPDDIKHDIWSGLVDTDVESFDYVGWSPTEQIEGKTDAQRFQLTTQALELIGVQGETLRMLWRALCIVLQLGNLDFEACPDNADASRIASDEELQALADLMGIDPTVLTTALTIRNVEARSEIFQVPLTADKAQESTDAFAKEIYAKTFLWLVRTINDATCAEKNYSKTPLRSRYDDNEYGVIGLLDIFGFETFEVNRFEQLCINYANEKLQQKFTQDIFRSVQLEYEMEGIELEEITYDDNTDVLDLVEGKMGLLAFLNEECVRPKGSDKTFVYKAQGSNKDNPCFFRDLHAPDTEFGIRHYAGKVTYDATNFVVKNQDTLPSDLQQCARLSTNHIVASALDNDQTMNPLHAGPPKSQKKKRRPKASAAAHAKLLTKRTSNIVAETVWTKFKNQLCRLMEALSDTQARYIRCIKPNSKKRPHLMEHVSTVEQLRCAGVVAAVTISRSAFPNRLEHLVVLERFKALWPKGEHIQVLKNTALGIEERTYMAVEILLTVALKDMEFMRQNITFRAFVMGKTRAYFRAGALEFLEAERLKYLGNYARTMQTSVRGYQARTKYQRHKAAVIRLQAGLRRRNHQMAYQRARKGSIRIQCWYRVLFAARAIVHLRRMIKSTMIQTQWRIRRDQGRFLKLRAASIVVQTMVRGALQRPKYRQALIDKKEEAKLENQLRALQRKLEEAEAKRIEAEKDAEERAKAAIEKRQAEEHAAREAEAAKKQEEEEQEKKKLEEEQEREREERAQQEAREREEERERDHQLQEEQHKLMDESGQMLEYLRKEVFKLRGQNQQLKTDFDLLKDNNQRLMDANASAGASFAALNQHAKQMGKQSTKMASEVATYKAQIQKLNLLQVELKDELKMKQATYIAEVQSRLKYQKSLQKITDMVQESCRDYRLVEKVLEVADECEMDYMQMGEQQPTTYLSGDEDEDYDESANSPRRSSIFSYLNPFS